MTTAVQRRDVATRLTRSSGWLKNFIPAGSSFRQSFYSPMKTISLGVGLYLFAWQIQAQVAVNSTPVTQTNSATSQTIVGYQTGVQDANSRVWQKIVQTTDTQGHVTYQTNNAYTELATGLNHLVGNQWVASKDEVDISADGNSALATNGQHQAYFPGDIYNGKIELVTPDGKQLYSRPVGLSYFDGTNGVLIAELTNSTGEVVGDNQVIYANAFTGFKADIRYTYTIAGFEQDIILRERPPTPASFGLNPDTTRLEVLTEFFNPPQPTVTASTVPTAAGNLENDQLNFGSMAMGQGKAFLLGTTAPTVGVDKQWLTLDGAQFLVEEVPVVSIADELENLPLPSITSTQPNSPLNVVSAKRLLPAHPLVTVPGKHPMQLAQAAPASQGLVLDYVTLNSSQTNYTFQGDTTYYISGGLNLYGTNTFEGGTVIKYANTNSAGIQVNGPINCLTGPYRPAIFTAKDDNSVGEAITGSTGNPTGTYAGEALTVSDYSANLGYMRFAYANTALAAIHSDVEITNSQFINDATAIFVLPNSVNLENVLIYDVGTVFNGIDDPTFIAQNITVHDANELSEGLLYLTNSLLIACTNLGSGFDGAYNYTNSSDAGIFQTVGAGAHYLAADCPAGIRGAGTTNIDPALLADLQTKTTYPPLLLTNQTVAVNTTLNPQAQRDNESPGPDLGYHYDPIDYIVDNFAITNATLTVTNGAAIASYNETGIQLQDDSSMVSFGSPLYPNWFVRYTSVQEGTNMLGGTNLMSGQTVSALHYGNTGPAGLYRFSKFTCPAACGYVFNDIDASSYNTLLVQDCELWGGTNVFSGGTNTVITLQNNLFEESPLYGSSHTLPNSLSFSNNLFLRTIILIYNNSSPNTWQAFNNAFDSCVVDYNPFGIDCLTNGYNAYLNCTNSGNPAELWPTNTSDFVTNATMAYETGPLGNFYQPSDSPLIDAGSTNANLLGLYHFTTQTNEVPETNSIVDIGYHYVATDTYGNPLDSNGDGTPDYVEDANGNGVVDNGETNWGLAILTQPVSQTVAQGTNVTFSVTAQGVSPLNYQWYFNGTNLLAGATSSSLTISNVQVTDEGSYQLVVTNFTGSLTSSAATLTLTCDGPPSGLVGWWQGESNALDSAGTDNGIVTNGVSYTNGVVGTAFNFDGTNGFIQIPDAPDLDPTNLTIEAWVRFSSLNSKTSGSGVPTGEQYIINKPNSTSGTYHEGYALIKYRSGSADHFEFAVTATNGTEPVATSSLNIQTNLWYHIAGVRGSNYIQLYVNGQLSGTNSVGFAQNYGTEPLFFGSSGEPSVWDGKLEGSLDEVSLYNRALSSNEIVAIYNAGTNGYGKCQLPPSIVTQPIGQMAIVGQPVTLTVVAIGSQPLSYQWYFNETNLLSGATNATLVLPNAQTTNTGDYSVTVSNGEGMITSTNVFLDVETCFSSLDVALVMDHSGSMSNELSDGTIKLTAIRIAATNFVQNLDFSNDQAAVFSFNNTVTTNQTLTNSLSAVLQGIGSITNASGSTYMSNALESAQTELTGSRHRSYALPVMVFLSDGDPTDNSNSVLNVAAQVKSAGTRLITIAVGTDADPNFMSLMATSTNDTYYATNSAQLTNAYNLIATSICRGSTNTAPTVSIISPVNQTLLACSNVVITATNTSSASSAPISWVEFFANGTNNSLGFAITPTNGLYQVNWIQLVGGTNVLTALVMGTNGMSSWSNPVTNYVRSLPAVTITSPTNGQIFSLLSPMTSTNLSITATAVADGATITGVSFYQGTNVLGTDTSYPYGITWSNVAAGTNTLTAAATDSLGATGFSFPVQIIVNPTNLPPQVYAGPDQITNLPDAQVKLSGSASDDGLPSNYLAVTWSKISGPGTVTFDDSTQAVTTATFSTNGTYVLQLSASDGQYTTYSTNTILVLVSNAPPFVYAGPDQTVTNATLGVITPTGVTLQGVVTDDGNPTNGSLISVWSVISGPGTVTFADINATNTIAIFSQPGSYQLQLTASDGQLTSSSNVTITITSWNAITYEATNYLYTYPSYLNTNNAIYNYNATNDAIPGFYMTNFDDSGWTNGQAGFGDESNAAGCLLDNSNYIKTYWPGNGDGTNTTYLNPYLFVRRHFNVPPGTTNLSMGFTVDNDMQVYINGILITPDDIYSNGVIIMSNNVAQFSKEEGVDQTGYPLASFDDSGPDSPTYLYFDHRLCCNYDDFILNGISTNVWHTNDNLLAVCVYDDGGDSFFDCQISLNAWITGTNISPAGTNSPPLVYAGRDQFTIISNGMATVQLNGLVIDDGLPGTGQALATWTNASSGLGMVTFSSPTNGFTNYNVVATSATFTNEGTYTIQLIADDGELSATSSVVVVVDPGITPPPTVSLAAPANGATYLMGDVIPLAATASASDGSTVTQVEFYAYSSVGNTLVGRATSSPYTANWSNLSPGDYALVAEATDSGGRVGYSTNQVDLQISAITNQPPVAVDDNFTVLANSANNVLYPLANDTDADTNSLTITSLSSLGVTSTSINTYNGGHATIINNGQAISYTPPPGIQGGDGFTYYISDGKGGIADAGIYITIFASAVPSVTLTAANYTTNAGAVDPLTATVSPSQYIAKVDFYQGTTLLDTETNGSGGVYTYNWTAIYNTCGCGFTAQATDIFGQVNTSGETNITVTLPTNAIAPVATLGYYTNSSGTVPLTNGVTIRDGIFQLYGQAGQSQGSNVVWQLGVYTVDGTTLLRNLTPASALVPTPRSTNSTLLAACDLSTLLNGTYQLRLSVIGDYIEVDTNIQFILESNLKLGQFSFSQQDLVIPVNGIPLTVTRTYNSINPDKGDFGYGWTYSLSDMDVNLGETREDVDDLGGDESDDLPGGDFSMLTSGGRNVTLTLPNGQRTTFYYQLSSPDANDNCHPQWLSAPGVTATLGVQGNPLFNLISYTWNEGDNGSGNVPYDNFDFEGFVLTNQDGTLYYIDRPDMGSHSSGEDWLTETYGTPYLGKIVERSGDIITINPNSIVHTYASGATNQIVFQRNADGLITSISDPNGLNSDGSTDGPPAVQYQYDSQDNLISVFNLVNTNGSGTYVTNSFSYTNANFPHYITGIINADGTQVAKNFYDDSGKLIEVDDANGNRTLFGYDTTNNTQTVIDRLGYTNTYVYDLRGNVIVQTNQLGQITTMAYDDNNNKTNEVTFLNGAPYATNSYVYDTNLNLMLSSTDPLGHTSTFAYDQYGELTNSTDADGNPTTNTYDSHGNLTGTSDALGDTTANFYQNSLMFGSQDALGTITTNYYDPTTDNLIGTATLSSGVILSSNTFTYDANDNRLTSTVWRKVNGSWTAATTTYIYDAMNRVTQTINPDGGTNTVVYDPTGKQQFTIDPLGNTNSYTYDALGQLIQTTYPDGTTESSAYDANGNRISSTDQEGRVTTYVYDALNRLVETIYPDNTTNTTVYDDVGRVAQTIDARGTITAFAYDAAGRRLAVTNAVGLTEQNISSYSYDNNGNQITFTDANGHTTTNVFDALNRQVEVLFPDGTTNSTGYDADGRSVAQTNQDGFVTLFGYDGAGRLISVTNALNKVTGYQYDEAGNEIAQVDALNRTNTYTYDGMGRKIGHTLPGGQSEGFTYDLAGNLIDDTNGNGVVIFNQYDALNRLTNRYSYSDGSVSASYTYTPTGQRATMIDTSGETDYSYDNRDRLLLKTVNWYSRAWTVSLNYAYDADGNVTNLWSSTTNGVNLIYSYDALNRLTNVLAGGSEAAGYAYDEAGNLQAMQYGNGVTNLYQYDSFNRMTNLVWKYGSATNANFHYQLGLSGNRTNLSETVNGVSRSYAWNYDHLYRLTNETISALGSLSYGYDAVGNRTNRSSAGIAQLPADSYSYDTNDELTADNGGDYTYDDNGNITYTPDAVPYTYDALNHLTQAGVYPTAFTNMAYDGDGNRATKTAYNTSVGPIVTFYVVDDRNPSGYPQVVEEHQYTSAVSQGFLSRVYNYGLGLISEQQFDTNTFLPSTLSYYGFDGHGSVRFLMDTNGSITDTYTYDAYGTLIASTGTTPNNYLYAGQQWDSDLGFYYNRARYLNVDTGRFWTSDSTDGNNEDPLSLHKYLYAADDPVNNEDPSGNDYGDFSINLSTIFLPFLKTPMLAGAIINATGASALNPTGLPVKTVGDTEIDYELNKVYNNAVRWAKRNGPLDKEPWHLFVSFMRSHQADTDYKGDKESHYLYQYNGTEHPLLLNRTFISSDINYLGFGVGYCARGILGLHLAIREHLWFDYPHLTPSANTFAAADTGYDWAGDKFWPSSGPRHGSGN
jgi:RHS repeat-associated protein